MSNIRRTEPPAHLFELPPDYTEKISPSAPKEAGMSFMAAESRVQAPTSPASCTAESD
jgi:hypothetical protein